MNRLEEIWKDVFGYEGIYSISSHGRVKSLDRAVTEMAAAETEEYLNAKQAAVFLGWKLQTLYNRIHDIPHTKNGKSLIFTKSALRKFMERK